MIIIIIIIFLSGPASLLIVTSLHKLITSTKVCKSTVGVVTPSDRFSLATKSSRATDVNREQASEKDHGQTMKSCH